MPIFVETLKQNWKQLLYWGIGLGLLGFLMMVILPDVKILEQYAEVLGSFPPEVLDAIGISDASYLASPDGFIAFGFFSYSILILAAYAVIMGMRVTANEEDEGILDIVLSHPVPRWRLVVEKVLAFSLIFILVIGMGLLGLAIGMPFSAFDINVDSLIANTISLIPPVLLMLLITVFIGTVVRRRTIAIALASFVMVFMYFIDLLGASVTDSILDKLRFVSVFRYYDPQLIMKDGLNPESMILLSTVALLMLLASIFVFQRRDINL